MIENEANKVGRSPLRGSGHEASPSAADASSQSRVPNAGAFTPGPWEVLGEDSGVDEVPYLEVTTGECGTPGFKPIAQVQSTFNQGDTIDDDTWAVTEEDKANARLIAAAPEMYAALEAMVHWNLKRGPFDEPLGESEQEPEVNLARAALTKARGGTP